MEEENRQLKQIVTEQAVDIRALKGVLAKSGEPADAARGGAGDASGNRTEPATRLRADGAGSRDLPVSQTARGGPAAADALTRVG